jgi:hypothetical protein
MKDGQIAKLMRSWAGLLRACADQIEQAITDMEAGGGIPSPPPADLMGLELYSVDVKLCSQWPSLHETWQKAYPAVDVMGEVRRAHAWEVANPKLRKINRSRFLNNWMRSAQDQARRHPEQPTYKGF